MSTLTKILGGTVLGAGAIAGYSYFKNLRKAKAELEIIPKANLYSLSWSGITVKVDVLLKNPTPSSFSIKYPFVKLSYKDSTIGSSRAINKDIKIPSYGEVMIEKILITIPVTSAFSTILNLIKALNNYEAIAMKLKTTTTVDISIANIPYESESEITIRK